MKKLLFVSVLLAMTFIGCESDDNSKVTEEPKTSIAKEEAEAAAKAEAEAKAKAEAEAEAEAKAKAEAEAVKEETKQLYGTWDLIDSNTCKDPSKIFIDKENSTRTKYTVDENCKGSMGSPLKYTLEGRKMIVRWFSDRGNSYYTFNIKDDILTMVQEDNTGGYLNVITLKYRKSKETE